MTDQEINFTIGEQIGYKWWISGKNYYWFNDEKPANPLFRETTRPTDFTDIHFSFASIPKFTEDLNLMHKAETARMKESTKPMSSNPDDHEYSRYVGCLREVLGIKLKMETVVYTNKGTGKEHRLEHGTYGFGQVSLLVFATARQKAEAFLKTLKLWKDD